MFETIGKYSISIYNYVISIPNKIQESKKKKQAIIDNYYELERKQRFKELEQKGREDRERIAHQIELAHSRIMKEKELEKQKVKEFLSKRSIITNSGKFEDARMHTDDRFNSLVVDPRFNSLLEDIDI